MLNSIKSFMLDESGLETVEWAIVGGIVVAVRNVLPSWGGSVCSCRTSRTVIANLCRRTCGARSKGNWTGRLRLPAGLRGYAFDIGGWRRQR